MSVFNFIIRAIKGVGNVKVDYAEDFDEAFDKAYKQKDKYDRVDVFNKEGKHFLKITRSDKNG